MRIEDWSRKRWFIFSLLLGLGLSYARLWFGPPSPPHDSTTAKLEAKLFREPVVSPVDQSVYPWVKDIYLYAPVEVPSPEGVEKRKLTLVTFALLDVENDTFVYHPGAILLQEPMPQGSGRLQSPDGTARGYLDAVSERLGHRVYQYVWWLEPQWVCPLWTGWSLLVVGIAWPIVLDRLIRAGYGRRSEVLPPSLWQRWKQWQAAKARQVAVETPAAVNPQGLSSEEMARLAAMEEGLRDFVAGAGAGEGNSPEDSGAPIEAPVRSLTAGPAQTQQEPAPKQEDKAYGGEFYPTVAHAKPKSPTDS